MSYGTVGYTPGVGEDIAKIKAYWAAVEQYAIEMADEDECLLLLTS
jgi:hypothetical protein